MTDAAAPHPADTTLAYARAVLSKFRGVEGSKAPPLPFLHDALVSTALTLGGMGSVLALHYFSGTSLVLNIGSLGASAVLLYSAPLAPLSQPRNVMIGHGLSALVGVGARILIAPASVTAAAALAVAVAVGLMAVCGVTHPPGGATALIAVVGGSGVVELGWVFVPNVLLGAAMLVSVALLGNFVPGRRYPAYW